MKFTITKVKNLRHSIFSMFNQIKNISGKVYIIVPDKMSVTIEKKLFECLNIESSFDIVTSTLTRFSQKLLNELNVEYSPISKIGSIVLLKKILNEKSKELKLFNSPSFSYSYSNTLLSTLTQFKSSQINSNDMVIDGNKPQQLKDKISDLKLILEEYETRKAGLVDSCDRLNMLAMNISKSQIVKNTHFFFIGFDDFTSQGYTVIEQLIKNALSVNIAAYQNGDNSFVYSNDMFEHLKNLAVRQGLPIQIIEPPYEDSELHKFLANNIYSRKNTQKQIISNEVNLYSTKNILEEIEFVARDIRQKIINGEKFKNFGVACYELEKNSNIIKSIFEKYELNYYLDCSRTLSNTNYYKFFVNYFKLFAHNFRLENLIQFINSPFINLPLETKIKLNRFLTEINFSGNLNYLKCEKDLQSSVDYLKNIITSFEIGSNANIQKVSAVVSSLISSLNINEQLDRISSLSNDNYTKKILSQVPKSFDNLLQEISYFYIDSNLEEILDIIESAGKEQKIMPIPQSIDCIQVIDADEVFTDFDNLYLVNCIRSTCPKITQDVGVILDKDISNLNLEKKLAPTISHINKMSKFKAFNSIQMFNNSLTISMSMYNESEKSEMVKDLETRLFVPSFIGDKVCHSKIPVQIIEGTPSYKALSRWDLIEYLSTHSNTQAKDILDTYGVKPFVTQNYLSTNLIENINFKEISCSALENYFKCPRMYFLSNLLKLKEENEQGIAMVDVGNMLHTLAQNFYKIANRKSLDLAEFTKKMLLKYMTSNKKLTSYIETPIYYNLIKEGVRLLEHLNYLDTNSQFLPTYFEYSFDSQFNKSIPLTNDVYLRGKIDRIDLFENYIRIIDYKTGNVDANLKDLYYGKKLQLFLYSKVAEEIFNRKLAGTFYLPIKNSILQDDTSTPYKLNGFYLNNNDLATIFDKRINETLKSDLLQLSLNKDGNIKVDNRSTKILTESKLNTLMNYALELSKQAINEIKEGYISPSPMKFDEQKTSCSFCQYIAICRKNSMKIPYRIMNDVNLESFGGCHE